MSAEPFAFDELAELRKELRKIADKGLLNDHFTTVLNHSSQALGQLQTSIALKERNNVQGTSQR